MVCVKRGTACDKKIGENDGWNLFGNEKLLIGARVFSTPTSNVKKASTLHHNSKHELWRSVLAFFALDVVLENTLTPNWALHAFFQIFFVQNSQL